MERSFLRFPRGVFRSIVDQILLFRRGLYVAVDDLRKRVRVHAACLEIPGERPRELRTDEQHVALRHRPLGGLAVRFQRLEAEDLSCVLYAAAERIVHVRFHVFGIAVYEIVHGLVILLGRVHIVPHAERRVALILPAGELVRKIFNSGEHRVFRAGQSHHGRIAEKVSRLSFKVAEHIQIPERAPLLRKGRRYLRRDVLLNGGNGGVSGCFVLGVDKGVRKLRVDLISLGVLTLRLLAAAVVQLFHVLLHDIKLTVRCEVLYDARRLQTLRGVRAEKLIVGKDIQRELRVAGLYCLVVEDSAGCEKIVARFSTSYRFRPASQHGIVSVLLDAGACRSHSVGVGFRDIPIPSVFDILVYGLFNSVWRNGSVAHRLNSLRKARRCVRTCRRAVRILR